MTPTFAKLELWLISTYWCLDSVPFLISSRCVTNIKESNTSMPYYNRERLKSTQKTFPQRNYVIAVLVWLYPAKSNKNQCFSNFFGGDGSRSEIHILLCCIHIYVYIYVLIHALKQNNCLNLEWMHSDIFCFVLFLLSPSANHHNPQNWFYWH